MFLDSFYKGLIGFFELCLISCKADGLPRWLMVVSPWPIIIIMVTYLLYTHIINKTLALRDPMDPDQHRKVYAYYSIFHILMSVYINFNTMVDFNRSTVTGGKLLLVKNCNVCSCFMVLWLAVALSTLDIFMNATLLALSGQRTNCILVLYQMMRPFNCWLQFQFYQRESALAINLLSLGEIVRTAFNLGWRFENRICQSISATPDLQIITHATHAFLVFVNGMFLILSANLDIRLIWWNMEYSMMSIMFLSLLSGWQEFRTGMFYIGATLANFVLLGSYAVYWGDRTIFGCVRTCIQNSPVNIANMPTNVPINPESGVVGPVQG